MRLLTFFNLSACMHFIVKRMIFLLFPSVRKLASILVLTPICIRLNKVLSFPLRALLFFVVEKMRFSSKVLPIMSVYTSISRMIGVTIWAPYSLEVEHVKVRIFLKLVEQVYSHLFFSMSKSTHISIVTGLDLVWVGRAELNFVFLRMIELFNSIMRSKAAIAHRTFEVSCTIDHIRADFTCVGTKRSSSILLSLMIEETFLRIMLIWNLALLSLEVVEINVADDIITGPLIYLSLKHTCWEDC